MATASAHTSPNITCDLPAETLERVMELLIAPVLPPAPFAYAITAGRSDLHARLETWATAARERVERRAGELQARDEAPQDWETAALDTAAHEWRVLEAFRVLHERARCPGLLFRLQTRRDFLTLCDRRADSGPAGYGERQRRVLAKRGIACRRSWTAARALVVELGLVGGSGVVDAEEAPSSDHESAPSPETGAPETRTDGPETRTDGPDTKDEMEEDEPEGLPVLCLAPVWATLGGLTKAGLEAVVQDYGVGLWAQFGERFYSSCVKADMLAHTRRVVRHHACLDAAQRLDEAEVETLYEWMRRALAEDAGRAQRDPDVRIAARLFRDFLAGAALSANGRGLSSEAWNRYREAELRRIGAFCYAQFYEGQQTSKQKSVV